MYVNVALLSLSPCLCLGRLGDEMLHFALPHPLFWDISTGRGISQLLVTPLPMEINLNHYHHIFSRKQFVGK